MVILMLQFDLDQVRKIYFLHNFACSFCCYCSALGCREMLDSPEKQQHKTVL